MSTQLHKVQRKPNMNATHEFRRDYFSDINKLIN